jgi:energy-coupling factor transporter ATP-binding protein EcfA2
MTLAHQPQISAEPIPSRSRTCHLIATLGQMARAVGADFISREALELAERAATEPFYIGCVGQPGSGKSTLLNALLGISILPVGKVSVPAIVTILRYGADPEARIYLADGERKQVSLRAISSFVTEQRNPANRKGIAVLEIFLPSPLLAQGICFVRAPGVASLAGGNHSVIQTLVPHFDAVVVVLEANGPMASTEFALIDQIPAEVESLIFVLNGAESLEERACNRTVNSIERSLSEHLQKPVGPLFRFSSRRFVKASAPVYDENSLLATLTCLAKESKLGSIRATEQRALTRLRPAILAEIERYADSLVRPVKESRQRVEKLNVTISEAEHTLCQLTDSFKAERLRLAKICDERRDRFLQKAISQALNLVHQRVDSFIQSPDVPLRNQAPAIADEISSYWLAQWLKEEAPIAHALFEEAAIEFERKLEDFLALLERFGDPGLAAVSPFSRSFTNLRKICPKYDQGHLRFPRQTILSWTRQFFHSTRWRSQTLEREMIQCIETFLSANTSVVLKDLDQRASRSTRDFENRIRSFLLGLRVSSIRTLARLEQDQRDGGAEIMRELKSLEATQQELLEFHLDPNINCSSAASD